MKAPPGEHQLSARPRGRDQQLGADGGRIGQHPYVIMPADLGRAAPLARADRSSLVGHRARPIATGVIDQASIGGVLPSHPSREGT